MVAVGRHDVAVAVAARGRRGWWWWWWYEKVIVIVIVTRPVRGDDGDGDAHWGSGVCATLGAPALTLASTRIPQLCPYSPAPHLSLYQIHS